MGRIAQVMFFCWVQLKQCSVCQFLFEQYKKSICILDGQLKLEPKAFAEKTFFKIFGTEENNK